MVIIVGSKNPSKKRAVEEAFNELGLSNIEVLCHDSESGVANKPIGYEIIRGADNRNDESRKYAIQNNIKFDYLCAIEGGFSIDENGLPFVVTYVIIEDKYGKKSTGKSLGLRLRKDMWDFIKSGGSLNELIAELTGDKKNKELQGITGYLTNGKFRRDIVDKDAVISAMLPVLFKENRDKLSTLISNKSRI